MATTPGKLTRVVSTVATAIPHRMGGLLPLWRLGSLSLNCPCAQAADNKRPEYMGGPVEAWRWGASLPISATDRIEIQSFIRGRAHTAIITCLLFVPSRC